MIYYPFDSRNLQYRSKIGAVAAGEALQLRLLLHFDAHTSAAFLQICADGGSTWEQPMLPVDTVDNYTVYETTVCLQTGVYWYTFRYESDFGPFYIAKRGSKGIFVHEPEVEHWQQTVYSADYKTPNWLRGGLIYQIFPDRFFASGKHHSGVPQDRFLCCDWGKIPEYRQADTPCRLGNDYYGGDLAGIIEKLPYLADLGVTCIYLNPVFEAHSNHRYNTADYFKIDSLLGSDADLKKLCTTAKKYGISVILDGVFSHTGDDSRYFNRYGRYDTVGAYQGTQSPYYHWYSFRQFPNDYAAWWGIPDLPEVCENNPDYTAFITGENGVLRHWMRCGVRGWRLDVADELPDAFLENIRTAVKSENPEGLVLGEVWEDASNKISYGARRKFLQGRQLDTVMNYPFAEAIVDFVCGAGADDFVERIETVLEHYPPQSIALLMNLLGTHDTVRILTRLAKGTATGDRAWQAAQRLTDEEYRAGVMRLKAAAILQYTLPGVPSLYYGDEAGMQGYGDPFCRGTFPWESADADLTEFFKMLGRIRRDNPAFADIAFAVLTVMPHAIAFARDTVFIAVNAGTESVLLPLSEPYCAGECLLGKPPRENGLYLSAYEYSIIKKSE